MTANRNLSLSREAAVRDVTCADCTVISTTLEPPAPMFEMEGFTLYFSGDVVLT